MRQLGVVSFAAERQLATINTGPSEALVRPLASKRAEFLTQLDDARDKLTKAAGVLQRWQPSCRVPELPAAGGQQR